MTEAQKRAQRRWGPGWNRLTEEMREAFTAYETLMFVLGSVTGVDDEMKDWIRAMMGWREDS